MSRRDDVIQKVVKMLRLARNAGTEAEAHTALTLAQKLMYAHEIRDQELVEPDSRQPIEDAVVDASGRHVAWKEYLAAIIGENFRCAVIISETKSTGVVRLAFVGRSSDVEVASEAFHASGMVAAHLSEQYAKSRPPGEGGGARASFLTGFLSGLCRRFDESAAKAALLVIADADVVKQALALSNAGDATGGALPRSDREAVQEGFASGYAHASGRRQLK